MAIALSEIWIYPVKSLGGFRIEKAFSEKEGFALDRRWMLVNSQGRFITQRECPQMALISVEVKQGSLFLRHSHHPESFLEIPVAEKTDRHLRVQVWGDEVDALACDPNSGKWLSERLNGNYKLVKMHSESNRLIDSTYSEPGEFVSFSDGYPYLVISKASLEDLNQRLRIPIPMNRFRPNFVIEGCPAFEEDKWSRMKIGNHTFRMVKPCARCTISTTDQETAVRSDEPLRTLASFRKMNGKVYFGQNLIPDQEAWIETGTEVNFEGAKNSIIFET